MSPPSPSAGPAAPGPRRTCGPWGSAHTSWTAARSAWSAPSSGNRARRCTPADSASRRRGRGDAAQCERLCWPPPRRLHPALGPMIQHATRPPVHPVKPRRLPGVGARPPSEVEDLNGARLRLDLGAPPGSGPPLPSGPGALHRPQHALALAPGSVRNHVLHLVGLCASRRSTQPRSALRRCGQGRGRAPGGDLPTPKPPRRAPPGRSGSRGMRRTPESLPGSPGSPSGAPASSGRQRGVLWPAPRWSRTSASGEVRSAPGERAGSSGDRDSASGEPYQRSLASLARGAGITSPPRRAAAPARWIARPRR